MKRTLYIICIGTLALSLTALGEENKHWAKAKKASAQKVTVQKAGTSRNFSAVNRSVATTPRQKDRAMSQTNRNAITYSKSTNTQSAQTFRNRNIQAGTEFRTRPGVAVERGNNFNVNRRSNVVVNRQRNVTVNNHWRGENFSGQRYSAFRNYHREWHNSDWWRHHHNRIVFVSGGWYYWNSGYWFPAWGYDPYATYVYDGPIYAYNGLSPDQVTVDVQVQLQRDGYYDGPVDGLLGPMTRQAISAFQADHGLAITSAIDQPTLASLGLA